VTVTLDATLTEDAQKWLDALPERIGTHGPGCHTDRHHSPSCQEADGRN
jgi:hypothetical protein